MFLAIAEKINNFFLNGIFRMAFLTLMRYVLWWVGIKILNIASNIPRLMCGQRPQKSVNLAIIAIPADLLQLIPRGPTTATGKPSSGAPIGVPANSFQLIRRGL
jgi:hypothetical protein